MAACKESPSQTAGPYVHIGCVPSFAGLRGMYGGRDLGAEMITGVPAGDPMTLTLKVLDGDGEALKDALVEIWQPGPDGGFGPTEGFSHWGRAAADAETGEVAFETLRPGAPEGQAPHVLVWIVARGINMGLTTRIYFPDTDNTDDPVFALAGPRAETLVCEPSNNGYRHVIRLQGDAETVFFDV
jgi:protocatechuate 3,4-dioxygenase alpha subunit